MKHERFDLPDWPRLMSVELAARYLGLSETTLRDIGPSPCQTEIRRVLYDKKTLDRWADRLSGQPLDEMEMQAETSDVENRCLELIRGNA